MSRPRSARLLSRAAGAIAAAGALALASCSTVQQEADKQAAQVADYALPSGLETALAADGSSEPEARGGAAEKWLSDPTNEVADGQGGATWVVRKRDSASLRVDVYQYWESGDFFPPDQGEAAWGVACRTYDVTNGVQTQQRTCPDGTPNKP